MKANRGKNKSPAATVWPFRKIELILPDRVGGTDWPIGRRYTAHIRERVGKKRIYRQLIWRDGAKLRQLPLGSVPRRDPKETSAKVSRGSRRHSGTHHK